MYRISHDLSWKQEENQYFLLIITNGTALRQDVSLQFIIAPGISLRDIYLAYKLNEILDVVVDLQVTTRYEQ